MRVFVSEYVIGGGWPEPTLPASLAREGRAMWEAAVRDFARLPQCRVVTTCDHRCPHGAVDGVEVHPAGSASEEEDLFCALAEHSDVVMVIAPELQGCLTGRVGRVNEIAPSARLLNASVEATHLCSDKLRLCEFLSARGINTPPTCRWSEAAPDAIPFEFPVVVKPRFGAGSQGVRLCPDREGLPTAGAADVPGEPQARGRAGGFIVQPYVPGRAVSTAVLRSRPGLSWDVLPIAEQRLSSDGRFEYLGGRMPLRPPWGEGGDALREGIDSVMRALPGLAGYVGFDFVLPESEPDRPTLIEINPRLTTSYLGYRRLARENLMARLLGVAQSPLDWGDETVVYFPDGGAERRDGS